MRITIVGTRGIPACYGGFETFAEEISPLLVKKGFDVSVECDKGSGSVEYYKGVKLFYSTVRKSENPLKYYYEGIKWGISNSDIILAASSAGSFFYPLNSFKRVPILTNPDGLEYKRGKWSFLKKVYLKLSEVLAIKLSDYIIADSELIKKHLITYYPASYQKIRVIEYGTSLNLKPDHDVLKKFDLEQNDYYLVVSRLEPENNLHIVIEGFLQSGVKPTLVIIGNILDNKYVKSLLDLAGQKKIRFLGGIYDRRELNAIRYSCKAYIHGHSVGGTNPSLLEAMGSGNIILAHDNVFNREVTAGTQLYFSNIEQFADKIRLIETLELQESNAYKELNINIIIKKYNWEIILYKYIDLFNEIIPV